jgi:hypothetical protein
MAKIEVLKKTYMEQAAEQFMMAERLLCSSTHHRTILTVLTGVLVETHLDLEQNTVVVLDRLGSQDLEVSIMEVEIREGLEVAGSRENDYLT